MTKQYIQKISTQSYNIASQDDFWAPSLYSGTSFSQVVSG